MHRFVSRCWPPHAAGALFAALVISAASSSAARANDGLDFVLPDNDGYGISECMKPGMDCGQVIADAWCEAHGHGHASAYGFGEDVTGSTKISTAAEPTVAHGSVIIHCGE